MQINVADVIAAARTQTHFKLGACAYSGPCVIGLAMTEEQRTKLVDEGRDGDSIYTLVNAGIVTTDNRPALTRLQAAFDNTINQSEFRKTLEEVATECGI